MELIPSTLSPPPESGIFEGQKDDDGKQREGKKRNRVWENKVSLYLNVL